MGQDERGTSAAYGKLPISREFLAINCDSRAARAFTDFVHGTARAVAELPADRTDALRLYIPVVRNGAHVVASLWPSADEGHKRRFPFTMFLVCDADALPRAHPGFCTAFMDMHAAHEKAYAGLGELTSAREFEAFMKENGPTVGPAAPEDATGLYKERADTYRTTMWAAHLYGTEANRFLVTLWRLHKLLQAGLSRLARDYRSLRLPLVHDHVLETQADAWLGLIHATKALDMAPSLLLGRAGEAASLILFFRPLEPADIEVLTGRSTRGLLDFATFKEPADMDGFDSFSQRLQDRLLNSHTTLASFPDILTEL